MFDISEKASEATPIQAELHRRHKEARARLASAGKKTAAKATKAEPPAFPAKKRPLALPLAPFKIIQDFVCQRYGLDRIAMISQARGHWATGPRFIAMHLVRNVLGMSSTRIGAIFGGRDHTTVIHALKHVARRCDRDPEFAANLAALECEVRRLIAVRPSRFGRYVLHQDLADYERLGWQLQAPLHDHGVLMVWLCDCPMREPLVA
jgi:hypothetical protein